MLRRKKKKIKCLLHNIGMEIIIKKNKKVCQKVQSQCKSWRPEMKTNRYKKVRQAKNHLSLLSKPSHWRN